MIWSVSDEPTVMSSRPDGRPPRRLTWRRRWTVRLALIAVAMVVLTLVAAANFVLVEVRLIIWEGDVRLSWALLGAVTLGFLLGLAVDRLLLR